MQLGIIFSGILALTATTVNCDLVTTINNVYQELLPDLAKGLAELDPTHITDMTVNVGDQGVLTGNGVISGASKFASRISKASKVGLLQNILSLTTTTTFENISFNLSDIRSSVSAINGKLRMICRNVTISQDFSDTTLLSSLTSILDSQILSNCSFIPEGLPEELIAKVKDLQQDMKERLKEFLEKVSEKLKDYLKKILDKLGLRD